jgi:hypothetical protein
MDFRSQAKARGTLIPFQGIISYFFCSTIFQNRAGKSEFFLLFTAILSPEREYFSGKKKARFE